MAAVNLRGVGKRFGDHPVIAEVSLDIGDGEFCVLVGPSGSGKSTLLRLIAGLEPLSAGHISIGARDVTELPPKARDIAMVFQSYALYPQMTVRENMGFGLKLARRPAAEIARRVDQAAQVLGLQPLLDRRPAALSGGQRQRVAMGRAMVREPAVFLFDEPLSNLDAALRSQVRSEIRELHARLKTTAVYVTHDQIEAMTMGDRIVVLRDGRIEQAGTPVELYERPSNRFVAGFIGSPAMNFFDAPLRREGGRTLAALGETTLELPPAMSAAGLAHVTLGLRPEHLRVGELQGAAPTWHGEIEAVEFTGAESQVFVRTPAGRLVATTAGRLDARPGARLPLAIARERLHCFDPTTGSRLSG